MALTGYRILLIAPDPAALPALQAALPPGETGAFFIDWVDRFEPAAAQSALARYDALLLDLEDPAGAGLASLAQICSAARNTPVIVSVSQPGHELALQAVRVGAQEVLVRTSAGFEEAAWRLPLAIERYRLRCATQAAALQNAGAYVSLAESLDVILTRWLPDTTLTFANPKAFQTLGSYVGQQWIDTVPRDERKATAEFYRQLASQPRTVAYEHPLIAKDGSRQYYHWVDMPILGPDGELIEFQSVGINITDRIKIEEELRKSEERYQQFITQSFEGIYRTEFDHPIDTSLPVETQIDLIYENAYMAECNTALAKMYNQPASEALIGVRLIDAHGGKDNPVNRAAFRDFIANGYKSINDETLEYTVDGHPVWFLNNTVGMVKAGKLLRLWGTCIEITTRKQAEELVQAQRDLARVLSTGTSEADAWWLCLEVALRVSGMDSGGIYLLDSGRKNLELVHSQGLTAEFRQQVLRYPVDSPPARLVMAGQPAYLTRSEANQELMPEPGGPISLASIPVIHQGRTIGCINLGSHRRSSIPEATRQALETVVAEVGNIVSVLRTEATLRKNEALLGEAQRIGRIGHWEWTAPDPEMTCSDMLFDLLDIPQQGNRLPHSAIADRLSPEECQRVNQLDRLAFAKWGNLDYDFCIVLIDGQPRWLHQHARVTYGPDGKPLRMIGTIQDITERKFMEDANRSYHEQLTVVLETGRSLATSLDQAAIFDTLKAGIYQLFPDRPSLFISNFDAERQVIQALYAYHDDENLDVSNLPEIPLSPQGQGNQSRAIVTRQPVIIASRLEQSFRPGTVTRVGEQNGHDTRSAVYVPMLAAQDQVLGVLQLQSLLPDRFSDQDLRALTLMANTAAVAIQNARLFELARSELAERRHAEAELRASEEKYRLLAENVTDVIWVMDLESERFRYVSPSIFQLRGYTAEEVMAEERTLSVTTDTGQHLMAILPVRIQEFLGGTIKVYTDELEQPCKDGSTVWTEATTRFIVNPETGRLEVYGVSRDITERKHAAEALQQINRTLEERVRQRTAEVQDLYENAPIGYHSLDADARLVLINQTELNWLGYSREEMLGRPYTEFIKPEHHQAFLANYATFRQSGSSRDLEWEMIRKDGSTLSVLVNRDAIFDEQGNYLRSRSIVFDNTLRKSAENALRHANLQLERAMRLKDEFLANMSHELRTPLNGILGFTQILMTGYRGPLNEEQKKYVRIIDSSGQHLLGLINDLLDLSKIEAGKLEINLETVIIADVCQASLSFIKEQATKKGIAIEFIQEPYVQTVTADMRRLKQILVNLLSNAVKFTPERGHVTLQVQSDFRHGCIEFTVSDTGVGIAPEDLQRLFTPFTQVDSSLTRQHEGTGLGLALVKHLAEMHGGSIVVESQVGQGSRFTVTLPWQPAPEMQQAMDLLAKNDLPGTQAWTDAAGALILPAGSRGLVLLAEDNETNRIAMGDFLDTIGYQVRIAQDGVEALEIAGQILPDLVLMDIQMPVMDGLESIRRMRADPRLAATPIIALTALAMPGDRERCLDAGANDYLSKPVDLANLAELMAQLTGRP